MYHTAFMYWMCGKLSFKSGMAFSFTKITPFGNAINDREERWQKEVLLPALILWTMVTLEIISLQEGFVFLHGFPNIEGFSVHHQTGGF